MKRVYFLGYYSIEPDYTQSRDRKTISVCVNLYADLHESVVLIYTACVKLYICNLDSPKLFTFFIIDQYVPHHCLVHRKIERTWISNEICSRE